VPCGQPTRERCQSIVTQEETEAGVKLIVAYRQWETQAASNCIESRQHELTRLKGINAELMKREISRCDPVKFVEGQDKLAELRKEAFELVEPIFKRLAKSLNDELNETAIAAEERMERAGLPVKNGDSWMLHGDAICQAIWSRRHIAERTLSELTVDSAIGATQWLTSNEEGAPFNFAL
jgi:hypothetical protein